MKYVTDKQQVVVPKFRRTRRSKLGHFWNSVKKAPVSAWFGLFIVVCFVIVALFAPLIAPHGEFETFPDVYAPWKLQFIWINPFESIWLPVWAYVDPSKEFLLGTDQLGRDLLSRLIYGARNTIGIAILTTGLTFLIGGALGVLAAIKGGWLDQVLSRFIDALMAIPTLVFTLLVLSTFGSSVANLIFAIAALNSTSVFRVSRSVCINISVMEFVEVARLRGEGIGWIMLREVLPNAVLPLISEFGLRFCFVFLTISALAFLGVGIQPPHADWGSMVRENAVLITYGVITPLLPAGAIALLTVSVNFVVDWLLHTASGLKEKR